MTKRMKDLIETLNKASDAYYNGKKLLMSDREWDEMYDELSKLEYVTGIILPDSPTQNVSADDTKGKKEEHEFPALSLAKTKSVDELIKWADGRPVNMSWKLDGLTLVATYDNGKLTKLLTRGNGTIGTNITHIAPAINHLPMKIGYKGHMVVRGEALISYSDFERINAEIENEDEKYNSPRNLVYANPRNLASGTLNLDDLNEIKRRNVQFIPFTLVHIDDDIVGEKHWDMKYWSQRMSYLKLELGFKTVDFEFLDPILIEKCVDNFTKKVETFEFPVDGLVICYDDWAYSQTGSVTGHHATRAGFAFKWTDETKETVVREIEYQTTRTGIISQVAVFDPVELCGTSVSRALIPNMNYRADLDIKIGDRIEVFKANMIIPCIAKNLDAEERKVKVINDITRYQYPTTCPCCGGTVGINESESGTMNLICTNPECTAKKLKSIAHFADRDCMNIMGLSEAKIEDLINYHFINNITDLYLLSKSYPILNDLVSDENERGETILLSSLEGWGKKAVKNLVDAIETSRKTDFVRFMHSMGIPNFGLGQAKLLKKHLDKIWPEYEEEMEIEMNADGSYDLMGLLYLLRVNHDYDFRVIEGFGEVINDSLCDWIDTNLVEISGEAIGNGEPEAWLIELLDELTFTDTKPATTGNSDSSIAGKTFVITGDVHIFKNRKELQEKIEELGGKATGSVTGKTDYLINNDVNSTSGKNKKAKELGVPIISEEDFCKMIGM